MYPNIGPVVVFFFTGITPPQAIFGDFYWPGASGSLLVSSPVTRVWLWFEYFNQSLQEVWITVINIILLIEMVYLGHSIHIDM